MGSKYPILPPSKVIKILEQFGFYYVSQKGSHIKYTNGKHIVIIPNHSEVAKGTLKSILNMGHIELDDFLNALQNNKGFKPSLEEQIKAAEVKQTQSIQQKEKNTNLER